MNTIIAIGLTAEIFVGGLVVSTGEPPAETVDRYADFNANGIVLWEAEEAQHWPYPAVVWATESGGQINDPTSRGAEAPLSLSSNVVGVQVGDEPQQVAASKIPSVGVSQWTNFSYWAPQAAGVTDLEAALDDIIAAYDGDIISVSEYNLTPIRLHVLQYFREKALERGLPYWQYLNAYSGWETDFQPSHSDSDLRWSAYTGLAMGYSGHVWFGYNIASEGHPEATQGGGSILHELDTWTETNAWQTVADINSGLQNLDPVFPSKTVEVTDELVIGTFGGARTIFVNNNHTATGSDEEVTIQFNRVMSVHYPNGVVIEDNGATIPAGSAVLVVDPWIERMS